MNSRPDHDSQYSMMIEWAPVDAAFLVRLPEWESAGRVLGPVTHGDTYEEAAKNGQVMLRLLIETAHELGQPLPTPHVFVGV